MNMQAFYRRLSMKPSRAHQRRLVNLTHISRAQILNATSETEWFIWSSETPSA
jgi:hypothetical protein